MDVFEQWETTTTAATRSGSSSSARQGSNTGLASGGVFSPESSPNRIHAAARRRGRGSQAAADFGGRAVEYPTDIFSLRRIDISAALAAAAASAAGVGSGPTTERLSSSAFLPPASFRSSNSTPNSARNNNISRRGGGSSSSPPTIDHAVMQNGVLILALSDATLIRWGLAGAQDPEIVFLSTTSSSSSSSSIYKLFLDPTGSHLIVSLTTAEHFYLHARGSKPKKLTTWHGVVVESIAFDRAYGSEASTRSILVGSRQGQLFETVLEWGGGGGGGVGSSCSSSGGGEGGGGRGEGGKEWPLVKVHELEEPLPIRSLEFETLECPSLPPSLPQQQQQPQQQLQRHRLVLAATSGPVRLYKFMGGPTFTALFATHREEGNLSFQDFGGSPSFTSVELGLFRGGGGAGAGKAETLAMLTEGGIFHGRLAVSPLLSSSLDGLIVEAALSEYVGGDGRPVLVGGRRDERRGSGGGSPLLGAGGRGRRGSGEGRGEGEEGVEGRVMSMVVTEFHFVLLFPKRLQVVSRLNGKQVQHFPLEESSGGRPLCLLNDAEQGSFWLLFTSSLSQVILAADQEDRHVWRLYLDKALLLPPSLSLSPSLDPTRRFDLAYKYCKTASARAVVDAAQANFFFRLQQYDLAARAYAKLSPGIVGERETGAVTMTTESFEEIALKFVDIKEEGALKVYLLEKLAHFSGGEGGGEEGERGGPYKTQRVMLCTWLMEIYLKRLAALGGGGGGQDGGGEEEEYERTVDEFRCFLRGHIEDLKIHPPTTYSLLASHGRKREILLYATLMDDVDRVVSFHVTEGEYGPALGVLTDAEFDRVEGLFYKYAYQLMENEPMRTLAVWMSKPGLNPVKLLPALAKHIALASSAAASSSLSSPPLSSEKGGSAGGKGGKRREQSESDVRDLAMRYLEYCISPSGLASSNHRSSLPPSVPPSSPVLYNYLLQLYALATDDKGEGKLLRFLRTHASSGIGDGIKEGGRVAALDLRYALRVCGQHHKTRACVFLYSCLGLYEEAVALALRAGEVELAKEQAQNAGNEGGREGGREGRGEAEGLQKRLWVMVARHLIEVVKVVPKEAMHLLDESNHVLSIEDLLPYFPEITTIDAFKEKICESLSSYSQTIQGLKQEMEELAMSTAEMEKAIAALKGRHLSLSTTQKCDLCSDPALTQHFYLFPCRHTFHATCLARFILPYLNPLQRRAVQALQEQLAAEISGGMIGRDKGRMSQRKAAQVEALQGEIDGYLAAECPWCGDVMIRTVDEPLVGEEEESQMEARAWIID